jgi:hypothetical protein
MIMYNNTIKNNNRKSSKSNSHAIQFLILTIPITGLLLPYSVISTSAQQEKMLHETQIKKSVTHNAVGHESHQVVQFLEPKNNTLYKGIITFTSSIPIDV